MLVEFVIIVVLGLDSLLGHHHTQQYTLILLQGFPLLQVLVGEIPNDLKIDWHIGSLEHLHDTA